MIAPFPILVHKQPLKITLSVLCTSIKTGLFQRKPPNDRIFADWMFRRALYSNPCSTPPAPSLGALGSPYDYFLARMMKGGSIGSGLLPARQELLRQAQYCRSVLLFHSLFHILIHLLMHPLIYWLTHSFLHSLINWLISSLKFIYSRIY